MGNFTRSIYKCLLFSFFMLLYLKHNNLKLFYSKMLLNTKRTINHYYRVIFYKTSELKFIFIDTVKIPKYPLDFPFLSLTYVFEFQLLFDTYFTWLLYWYLTKEFAFLCNFSNIILKIEEKLDMYWYYDYISLNFSIKYLCIMSIYYMKMNEKIIY